MVGPATPPNANRLDASIFNGSSSKTPIFIASFFSFCLGFLFQINWLGSNFHDKHTSCSGSAILTTEGVLSQFHDSGPASGGKLILAELPVKPTKFHVDWTKFALENADNFSENGAKFNATIYGDDYDFVELDPTKKRVSLLSYMVRNVRTLVFIGNGLQCQKSTIVLSG